MTAIAKSGQCPFIHKASTRHSLAPVNFVQAPMCFGKFCVTNFGLRTVLGHRTGLREGIASLGVLGSGKPDYMFETRATFVDGRRDTFAGA